MEFPVRLPKEKQDDVYHQSTQQTSRISQSSDIMSNKSELATDEEEHQKLRREFEAELAKEKELQATLEHLELLESISTAEGLYSRWPTMMALIKHRNTIKIRVAMINNIPLFSTFTGYGDGPRKIKTKLEADLKELDAAVNDILAKFNKAIPADNLFREAALKAIYDHTQPDELPVARWEEMLEATKSPDFDLLEMWMRLH
ncbi:hypothetical protein KCU85_g8201, partial [Aureobasidium melanogenum]